MQASTDGELLVAIRDGNRVAWAELVRRYTGRLWAVARAQGVDRSIASDVVQATWLALVDERGRIREPAAVGAWLATVAKHEAIKLSRRAGREIADPAVGANLADALPSPDASMIRAERAAELRAAVARLGASCRELLGLMFSDDELSYSAISAVTGMPVGSIGPTRQRCLEHLRKSMES